ncbi:MAG: hypothetical protein HC855_15685 [Rhizobiales bacterium]|nr:hypothetical protein [Hyphomicrobiales bacterium]
MSYQIRADSLPEALQLRLKALEPVSGTQLRSDDAATAMSRFWEHLLSPLTVHPKGSDARGKGIKECAARQHLLPDGTKHRFDERTIRRKLSELEAHGLAGLAKAKRCDAGQQRVILTRAFDAAARAAGKTDGDIEKVATRLRDYVRGLIVQGRLPQGHRDVRKPGVQ